MCGCPRASGWASILGGRPYRGTAGVAGELGHVTVAEGGSICRCGNRGCLETVASPVAVARLLETSRGEPTTVQRLLELVHRGDRGARRAVADAGAAVGRAIAAVVNVLNPELVVVGGELAGAGAVLLDPIRTAVERHAVAPAVASVRVTAGELGEQAEVLGAAALLLGRAPEALARRLVEVETSGVRGAQGLGDVPEVRAHRRLGGVAVPAGDGVDDRGVLGERAVRAAGDEDRAVLEAHELGVQRGHQPHHGAVASDLQQRAMQDGVLVGRAEQVAGVEALAHAAEDLAQRRDVLVRRVLGGVAGGQPLQRHPRLEDLRRLVLAHQPDARAAVALVLDEPLLRRAAPARCGPRSGSRRSRA